MKSKLVISLLVMTTMLCPAFAFAAEQRDPGAVDETVAVAEDATTGDIVGDAVQEDELYAPATAKDIKAAAKEETDEVKGDATEAVENIKEDEQEASKEAKM